MHATAILGGRPHGEKTFSGISPESPGHNLALTVLYVLYSLSTKFAATLQELWHYPRWCCTATPAEGYLAHKKSAQGYLAHNDPTVGRILGASESCVKLSTTPRISPAEVDYERFVSSTF